MATTLHISQQRSPRNWRVVSLGVLASAMSLHNYSALSKSVIVGWSLQWTQVYRMNRTVQLLFELEFQIFAHRKETGVHKKSDKWTDERKALLAQL